MKEIQIHPFDLSYEQIAKHRQLYKCPNGALSNSFPVARASLDQVFMHLQKHLQLHPQVWRNILKFFDQSTFDINFSQEDFDSKFQSVREQKQFRMFDGEDWTVAKKQDLVLLSNKIEFSDFLKAIQRESVLRDILAEHQMYFHSTKRLFYKQDTKLITKQALEAINLAKQTGNHGKAQIPTVTYLIDNLLMFNFQGVNLYLICFENQSVQVFESRNGHFIYEFNFYDNVFEHIKGSNNRLSDQEKQKKEEDLEVEFKKSGMSRIEFNLMKRKAAREKNEYVPEPPPLGKPIRTHFHRLNAAQQRANRLESAERKKNKNQASNELNNFLNMVSDMRDSMSGPINYDELHQETILEEEERVSELGRSKLVRMSKQTDSQQAIEQPHGGKGSPGKRWERVMNENTEASMRDSRQNFRDCCFQKAEAFIKGKSSFLNASMTQQELMNNNTNNHSTLQASMMRGKSAGVSRQGMYQRKVLNKNFMGVSSEAAIGIEATTAAASNAPLTQYKSTIQGHGEGSRLDVLMGSQDGNSKNQKSRDWFSANRSYGIRKRGLNYQREASLKPGNEVSKPKIMSKDSSDKRFNNVQIKQFQNPKSAYGDSIQDVQFMSIASNQPKILVDNQKTTAKKTKSLNEIKGTVRANKDTLDREEYIELRKQERQRQSEMTRQIVQRRKERMEKVGHNHMTHDVLGLDTIAYRGDFAQINDRTNSSGQHAYGLDHKLFMSQRDQRDLQKQFQDETKSVTLKKYTQQVFRLRNLKQTIGAKGIKDQEQYSRLAREALSKDPVEKNQESIQRLIEEVHLKQNALPNKIHNVKQKSRVFGEWLQDLDDQMQIEIDLRKNKPKVNKEDQERRVLKLPYDEEDSDNPEGARNAAKKRKKQIDERKRRNLETVTSQPEREPLKIKKNKNRKQTYPVCMSYYEPYNIAIFGLVSKEIQIHQLKQTGVRRSFSHCQSMRVEHMIVSMTIECHKGGNNLIVVVGTQSKKKDRSEVVAFILDPKLEFEVLQSFRWTWPYIPNEIDEKIDQQITQVYYKAGCGLIICSFTGFIEIYDAINVNHSVWDNGKLKQKSGGGSISTVCYSEALDIIAYAGVSGKIYVLDQTTKNSNGQIQAHKSEIITLSFYDQQHQLISVSQTGEIGLWDAQKLTKIQLLRNSAHMSQKIISTSYFYQAIGRVLMATTKIFNYDLAVDQTVKIKTDQMNGVARDYLRQFLKQLKDCGIISQHQTPTSQRKTLPHGDLQANLKQIVSEEEYIAEAYKDESLRNCIPPSKEFNSSVVASIHSNLVGIIMDTINFQLYTVDSDLMVRVWSCSENQCIRSYLLETRDDQIREANQDGEGDTTQQVERKKAQLVRSDPEIKFLLVAFEAGEIQVNNMYTGALIYNNSTVKPVKIENEITQMKFFNSQTKFWIAASCWEGRVAFISRPQVSQGRNFLMFKKCRCSHQRDVISLDINSENQLVTASMDNVICFWNSFNGVESKKVHLPEEIASLEKGQCIQFVSFPFPEKKDILLIVINNGECYVLETQTEKFMSFAKQQQSVLNYADSCEDSISPRSIGIGEEEGNRDSVMKSKSPIRSVLSQEKSSPDKSGGERVKSSRMASKMTKDSGPSNKFLLGRVAPYSTVAITNGFIASISENGSGFLNHISFMKSTPTFTLNILSPNTAQSPIILKELNRIQISNQPIDINKNPVTMVQIVQEYNMIITGQIRGTVTLVQLSTCLVLGVLNSGFGTMPRLLKEMELEKINEESTKVLREVKKRAMAMKSAN